VIARRRVDALGRTLQYSETPVSGTASSSTTTYDRDNRILVEVKTGAGAGTQTYHYFQGNAGS
jgi:hypothetical protein